MKWGRRDTGISVYPKEGRNRSSRLTVSGLFVMFLYFGLGAAGTIMAVHGIFGFSLQESSNIIVLVVWAIVLLFGIMVKGGRLISLINLAIILSSGLLVGRVPPFLPLCMLLLYVFGNFAMSEIGDSKLKRDSGMIVAVVSVVLITISYLAVTPLLKPLFTDQSKEKMLQLLVNGISVSEDLAAAGGIGGGRLNNAKAFDEEKQIEVARVEVDGKPESDIYLKCYVGEAYTGQEWTESYDGEEEAVEEAYYLQAAERGIDKRKMTVYVAENDENYQYEPYFSSLTNGVAGVYEYDYFALGEIRESSLVKEPTALLRTYQDKVYTEYLSYPGEQLERLAAQCRENPKESTEEIAQYIKSSLASLAKYNLQVGTFPEDEEFTEYFLYERKEGYCVHFATAATLMFRMYGIPARFVTGYIAQKEEFSPVGGVYAVNINSSRAHAWTEIYIAEQGWVPVETTPGYMKEELSAGTEAETSGYRETEAATGDLVEETSEKSGNMLVYGAFVMAIVILAMGLILTVRCILILMGRKRKRASAIFHDIVCVLEMGGLPSDVNDTSDEFADAVTSKFPWLEEAEAGKILSIALQANYGQERVTREDTRYLRKMYRKICRGIYRESSLPKRIAMRYIYAYF